MDLEKPLVIDIGFFQVTWYALIIIAAILIGLWVAKREGQKKGFSDDFLIDVALYTIPLAIVGARLYYVFFQWQYFSGNPIEILATWQGGLAIHGGIAGGVIGAWILCKKRRKNFWILGDVLAPSLILGQAIGRLGNYLNQEAFGYPTDLPWGIYMHGAYRHPTFFYEMFWNLIVFFFLLWYRRKNEISGRIFWAYLGLYSAGRFFIEAFRTDSLMLGPFRIAQVVSIILILGAVIYFYQTKRLRRDGV